MAGFGKPGFKATGKKPDVEPPSDKDGPDTLVAQYVKQRKKAGTKGY